MSVCLCCHVSGSGLVKVSYHPCKQDYETAEEARAQHTVVEPLMN
jgi:hypothetical protein